jgi:hypothetical protein
MYRWFNQHLRLGQPEPVVEEDYRRLTREELSVWDAGHPRPEGGPEFERRLLRWLTEDTGRQLKAMVEVPAEFERVVGGAVDVLVGRGLPASGTVEWTAAKTTGRGGWREILGRVRNFEQGEDLPTMLLAPEAARGDVVLWLDARGKAGLGAVDGAGVWTPRPGVRRLLEAGVAVVGVDLFEQGEFLADGGPLDRTARVKNPREAAAYTFGYNAPVFTHRVRDVLSVLAWVRSSSAAATIGVPSVRRVDAVALDGSGPGLAVARAAAGSALDGTAIHTGGFRFGKIRDLHDVHFLPGGAKYLDLPGFLARDVPGGLWLAGEGKTPSELPEAVSAAYRRSAGKWQLASGAEAPERVAQEAVDWLLRSR